MDLTYDEAYRLLSNLVEQIEDDSIQLDSLAEKIKQAQQLIAYCEKKLRTIEKDLDESLDGK